MTEIIQQITYRGTRHQPDSPFLDCVAVTAVYPVLGQPFSGSSSSQTALKNVTFQAAAGEQIAIIGPNGAGKSTLLKLIAGILKPDAGEIHMTGHSPDKHICIAYVPQRSQIDWTFPVSVADVVMMGRTRQIGLFRRPGSADREIVQSCLERVNAWQLADKQIGELSGGQQQRVYIARALAQETNLLLLDEPFTGLDLPSRDTIFEIVEGLRPDNVTVLVATHDLNLASARFDRVMLLNKQILALGPATAVLTPENLLAAYGGHIRF